MLGPVRSSSRHCTSVIAVAATVAFGVAAAAGCSGSASDPIIGCWQWNGGVVVASADGTLVHGTDSGTWTDDGGGMYVFTWNSGWVDGIALVNGVLYETHLATPPGQTTPSDFTAPPTSCSNASSSGTSSGSPQCGASGASCSSSADCCGVCELDSSSSFYLTCE